MIPETISHYRVIRKLGAGGMGEVYLAEDSKLDRTVALKILPGDFASDPDRMRRFVQEAKAASALSHPGVCVIYEVGQTDDGHPFIAMEYVEGQTLDAKINNQPLSFPEIVEIAIQAVDALDEAHSKGVTHRDIKPANLIITPRGQVKVLDFGLAKMSLARPENRDSQMATVKKTDPGVVMGTVQYMSPEQALGQEVDHRTDIFSMGVVIYEMATGRLPFSGATVSETIVKIAHSQPEAIARFNYDTPPEIERIIRKCLEKDKDRRYQSARELLIDLKNFKRDGDSGAARTAPALAPQRPGMRSGFKIAAALVILAAAGVAAYLFARSGKGDEKAMESLVVLPLVNATADPNSEYLSDGITESIINSLSQLPNLKVIARTTAFRYKGKEVELKSLGRELKVDAAMTGKVFHHGDTLVVQTELVKVADGTQIWGGRYNRKMADLLAVQEEMAKEISERLRLRLSGDEQKLLSRHDTQNTEAYELWLKGRYHFLKWTAEGRRKAIEHFNQALEKDPAYAPAFAWLSGTYDQLGLRGEMPREEARAKAKAYAVRALELDESLAEAHAALGITRWRDWDWAGAEKELVRAIELSPKWSDCYDIYATFLNSMGRLDEALVQAGRAQEIDPLSLNINVTIGHALYLSRRYDQALEQYRKTLELYPDDPGARYGLGWTYAQMSRYEEAAQEANKAAALSGGGKESSLLLAYVYALSGKGAEARKVLDGLKGLAKQGASDPYDVALLCAAVGEKDQAFEWLERAYEARSEQMGAIKVDPRLETIRADSRYRDLLRRMKLA